MVNKLKLITKNRDMDEMTIIPFGKYKGQPLEAIKHDTQYLDWLQAQDWFRTRYPQINTLIVNNFTQPSDTPDHNAMVARFLDNDFCTKVSKLFFLELIDARRLILPGYICKYSGIRDEFYSNYFKDGIIDSLKYNRTSTFVSFEDKKGSDIRLSCDTHATANLREPSQSKTYIDDFNSDYYSLEEGNLHSFEVFDQKECLIECKPVMSDDFPSILRQCRNQGSDILVIGEYTGTGATLDQVRKMFGNIKILTMNEIESIELPRKK